MILTRDSNVKIVKMQGDTLSQMVWWFDLCAIPISFAVLLNLTGVRHIDMGIACHRSCS